MTNDIETLNAELYLTRAEWHVRMKQFLERLDKLLDKWFIHDTEAVVLRRWYRVEHWDGEVSINFEIGFYDETEGRVNFGTDTSFEFSSAENVLYVGHGSCGRYSRNKPFHFLQHKLVAHVYDHLDEIESELAALGVDAALILCPVEKQVTKLERRIHEIHILEEANRKSEIEQSLKAGDIVAYHPESKHYKYSNCLFKQPMTIQSITSQNFMLRDPQTGCRKRVPKAELTSLIFQGHVTVNNVTYSQEES